MSDWYSFSCVLNLLDLYVRYASSTCIYLRLSLLRPLTMELCVNFLFIRSFLFLWFNIMISNFIWLFFSFRHFNCLSVCVYVLFANVYDIVDNRIIKMLTKKQNKTHIKPICAQVRLWMTVKEKKHTRSYWDRDRESVCAGYGSLESIEQCLTAHIPTAIISR